MSSNEINELMYTSQSGTWSPSDAVTRYSQLIDNVTNISQREGLISKLDLQLTMHFLLV